MLSGQGSGTDHSGRCGRIRENKEKRVRKMADRLRIGVIGIGNMGSEHCRILLSGKVPEAELTCVADLREDRREWARKTLPVDCRIFSDGSSLIRAHAADAVIIAVPHPSHPALTVEALEAGLDVLCEKPIAVTVSKAREMIDAADRSGRTFALMFNQRTNGTYRKIRELMQNGTLGELKRVTWIITDWYRSQTYYDSGDWRATWAGEGGGVLINQCPHQLDLLQWLCGMPVRVQALCRTGQWHDIEVEDDVTAVFTYASGATAAFITSTGDLPGTNRLEITGDRGKLVCENGKILLWQLPHSEREWYRSCGDAYPHADVEPVGVPTDGENPQHAGVTRAFVSHILHGTPLVADGREGIHSLMISNACYLSSWTGKAVELPMNEESVRTFDRMLAEKQKTSRRKDVKNITFDTDHSGTGRAL